MLTQHQLNLARVFLLGISSGLPIVLVLSTFSVWLFELEISKTQIGLFSLATLPYSIKFLWSPLIDGFNIPYLAKKIGHRKSWILLSQIALIFSIILLSILDHQNNLLFSAIVILMITFFSATQDIVIDAYRIELADDKEQGIFASFVIYGYRVGMLISGGLALYLSTIYDFEIVYQLMALVILIISFFVFFFPEKANKKIFEKLTLKEWVRRYIISPFINFAKNDQFILILIFIILYKFGDAFAGVMTNPFLLEIGFNKIDIAQIVKTFGLAFTLFGLFIGGIMVEKYSLRFTLIFCGVIQALTNLIFCLQYIYAGNKILLFFTIGFENLAASMGTVAFVAFISRLCNRNYTATQYALLSSFAVFGRTFLASSAGLIADNFNWILFFIFSTIIAIPAILIIFKLKHKILD